MMKMKRIWSSKRQNEGKEDNANRALADKGIAPEQVVSIQEINIALDNWAIIIWYKEIEE